MEVENEISLQEIAAILWQKGWLIILSIILGAGIGFGYSHYIVEPTYSSKMSMYVNNNKDRVDSALNINDLNVSQKLVTTYIEILKSDKVLDKTIAEMGLLYTNEELREMISANSVNGTEILEVKVTSKDPQEAADIANALAKIAPSEIIRVVQAGDVQLIDEAVVNPVPVAPNKKMNTLIAALLGLVLSAALILVLEMLDISVKSVEDLKKHYELSILGSIPDIIEASNKSYK